MPPTGEVLNKRIVLAIAISLAAVGVFLAVRHSRRDGGTNDPRRNVLLITLDTTRADRLGCYGYKAALTPALDALAARGVLFEQAHSSIPLTLPSHTTMNTGLQPPEHGLRANGSLRLDIEQPTLAELLKRHDYQTGAFIAAFALDSRNGLDRGFDIYEDDMSSAIVRSEDYPTATYRPGNIVVDKALAWLAKRDNDKPFFCWVHLYDPHQPYAPHAALNGTPFAGRLSYDGEIAFADMQVARLNAFLNENQLIGSTLVVAAGDHGEGLGDHGEPDHGFRLYETTLRVPLIFSLPGRLPEGRRARDNVSLVDLFGTILDLLEIPGADARSGRSLAEALAGHDIGDVPAYGETNLPLTLYNWSPLRSLTTSQWKYIRSSRVRLFDRQADPAELHNLAATLPDKVAELEKQLKTIEQNMVVHQAEQIVLTDEAARKLEALGYVAGGHQATDIDAEDYSTLPDVEDMTPVRQLERRLLEMGHDAPHEQRIPILRQMIQLSPNSPLLRRKLADPLSKSGHLDEAIEHLNRSLELDPNDVETHQFLGAAFKELSKPDLAIKHFSAVVALAPNDAAAHRELGEAYRTKGRFADAERAYAQAVKLQPDDALSHKALAIVLGSQRKFADASAHFAEAIRLNPVDWQAHYLVAGVFKAQGNVGRAITEYRAALRLQPNQPAPLNSLAWILATHPDAAIRNGREAVELAERACQATNHADPGLLDTLAAAYAEAGRFTDAVATIRKAHRLATEANDAKLAEELDKRLNLFEQGQAFHE